MYFNKKKKLKKDEKKVGAPLVFRCKNDRTHHKVILLGEPGVGKTSLYKRFDGRAYNSILENNLPEADFLTKEVCINLNPVFLQVWDTAGQERYRSLVRTFSRDTEAAIVVYDLNDGPTLSKGLEWIEEVRSWTHQDIPIALVGNKKDLLTQSDEDQEEIEKRINGLRDFALSKKIKFFELLELSAKDDPNLDVVLWDLATRIIQNKYSEYELVDQGTSMMCDSFEIRGSTRVAAAGSFETKETKKAAAAKSAAASSSSSSCAC